MLELKMNTDLQKATPQEISFNFDELKAELAERLTYYNCLVVTEAGIREAKDDRAKLNKLRTAIDTRRKDVKKEYLKPYSEFEAKIKELTALIDQPIGVIDDQLDKYEEKRKEQKRAQVEELYQSTIPEAVQEVIPLDRIFDKRWLNVGTSLKGVTEELKELAKRTEADLIALDTIDEAYKLACREKYIATLDIAEAIAHQERLKAAEEAMRAREEEKKAREAERIAREEKKAQEAKMEPQEAPAPQKEPQQQEKKYALRLEFHVTKEQAIALRNFIDQNQMEYIKL